MEHYGITELDKRLKKNELKTALKAKLSEKNILSISYFGKVKESMDIYSGLSFDQKKEILEMQQIHDREMAKVVKISKEKHWIIR